MSKRRKEKKRKREKKCPQFNKSVISFGGKSTKLESSHDGQILGWRSEIKTKKAAAG